MTNLLKKKSKTLANTMTMISKSSSRDTESKRLKESYKTKSKLPNLTFKTFSKLYRLLTNSAIKLSLKKLINGKNKSPKT